MAISFNDLAELSSRGTDLESPASLKDQDLWSKRSAKKCATQFKKMIDFIRKDSKIKRKDAAICREGREFVKACQKEISAILSQDPYSARTVEKISMLCSKLLKKDNYPFVSDIIHKTVERQKAGTPNPIFNEEDDDTAAASSTDEEDLPLYEYVTAEMARSLSRSGSSLSFSSQSTASDDDVSHYEYSTAIRELSKSRSSTPLSPISRDTTSSPAVFDAQDLVMRSLSSREPIAEEPDYEELDNLDTTVLERSSTLPRIYDRVNEEDPVYQELT